MECEINECEATARVVFDGLFLMWLSPWGDLEIGFIRCEGHDLTIRCRKTRRTEPVNCSERVPESADEIQIKVPDLGTSAKIDLDVIGASKYERPRLHEPGPFNRLAEDNSKFHFRWIFDMEGQELHSKRVGIIPTGFMARMRIKSGLVYTPCLSDRELDLLEWNQSNEQGELRHKFGRVAEKTAVQIVCKEGNESGVRLAIGGKQLWLPYDPGNTREILVRNRCDEQPRGIGTHFRQFYEGGAILCPPNVRKVDFRISGEDPLPVPQLLCNGAFGGTI
jgi:hypothetical protein